MSDSDEVVVQNAKLILEVQAGVIPGEPNHDLTRRWVIGEYELDDKNKLVDVQGAALNYAAILQNPEFVNWVRLDWVWL